MGEVTPIDYLALPKRQKVFERTFLPGGDILPVWSNVSLDTKLPVPPSPSGKFTLYTNKIGEPKYISRQRYDFDLTNPQGREAPGPYDSLADPSLKYYFMSPRAKRHLVQTGLVTDRGEIKCTVQEFNQYREFIRYRAVTELALQKKRENRLKEEDANRLFLDWPKIHKLNKVERHKQTMSEPPRKNWTIGGLEMYEQNLANVFKKRKEKKNGQLKKINAKEDVQKIKRKEKINPDKTDEVDENKRLAESKEQNKSQGEHPLEEEQTDDEVDEKKIPESTRSNHHSRSLVKELRQREQELHQRLEQQQRQRTEEHNRKIAESWRERQQRQELLLQHEAEIEALIKEKRLHQIRDREVTLQQQRKKQEEKLMKIKKELAGGNKQGKNPKCQVNKHGKGNNKGG